MDVWIVSIILIVTMFLLVSEKLTVDLTAIGAMVALMITGILAPAEAVKGFSNPAVITVGAMFLVSRAMIRTGAVGFFAQKVIQYSKGNVRIATWMVLIIVGVASAFINNTPVVVLFIPIILSLSCEYGFSPSKLLIPVSYASILAGTCTLIGTATNIIVSDLSAIHGFGELGMFELAVVGLPIAIVGIIVIVFASPRLMPGQAIPICETGDEAHRRYLSEIKIPKGSALIDADPKTVFSKKTPTIDVLEVIRYSHIYYPDRDQVQLAADDLLIIKGALNDLVAIFQDTDIELPAMPAGTGKPSDPTDHLIVELIIPPQSTLLNNRLMETPLYRDPDVHVLAIKRSELHYTEQKVHDVRLKIGDILLIRCPEEKLARIRGAADLIIIEDVHHEIIHKGKARWAISIFIGMVLAATTGLADIMVSAVTAVFLMALTGCLHLRDTYQSLQGNVLILIAGAIALGTAMEKTGVSQLIAEAYLGLFQGASPAVILAGFLFLTSLGTQLLSNNAIAVLLFPIAIATATAQGLNPKPFIIALCLGASACFASPIGYQTNMLVYGPGSYRFKDYLKLGIPLNLLVMAFGTLLIPVFWPF